MIIHIIRPQLVRNWSVNIVVVMSVFVSLEAPVKPKGDQEWKW